MRMKFLINSYLSTMTSLIETKKMIWLLFIFFIPECLNQTYHHGKQGVLSTWLICDDNVRVYYPQPRPNETIKQRSNEYYLFIPIPFNTTTLLVKFFSEVTVELNHSNETKVSLRKLVKPKNSYGLIFSGNFESFRLMLQVSGPDNGTIPYVESILRDYEELCLNPIIGYLDKVIKEGLRKKDFGVTGNIVDESCGRRKVIHTQLIVQGQPTKPGDWPWHVAIMRLENSAHRYICGGTLLTSTLVLTAAHCASIRGNVVVPEILSIHLGKHNLLGGDIGAQEREVFRVIIHPKFDGRTQDNDIALLKLMSEAVITEYVQPACLWTANMLPGREQLSGTVVGWGFNQKNSLSPTLQKATIPILPELICYKSNPTFFHQKLNENKFCAGFANGTSVCNGDSGGGLMIFVPDSAANNDTASGAWYVRGIVSIAPSLSDAAICDPYEYTIFTDVGKYRDWLLDYME